MWPFRRLLEPQESAWAIKQLLLKEAADVLAQRRVGARYTWPRGYVVPATAKAVARRQDRSIRRVK